MAESAWARVVRIARSQHGLVSRSQALQRERGQQLSESALQRKLVAGELIRVYQGVYRFPSSRVTWEQRALATLLWLGPDAALALSSAAFLFGLDGFKARPSAVEVLVSHAAVNGSRLKGALLPGVVLHRTRSSFAITRVAEFRVTDLTRTLLDLSGTLRVDALEDALDSAQRMYPGTDTLLEQALEGRVSGLQGAVKLKHLLAERGGLSTDSPLEVRVFRALRRANVRRPETQVEVFDDAGYVTRLDFAWNQERVALHVDGYAYHHQRSRFEHDRDVGNRLAALNWHSVSVTSRGLDDGKWLVALKAVLASRAPQLKLL